MSERRPPISKEELVSAFVRLFNEIEPETSEEINTTLRSAGYDPEQVAAQMRNHAQQEIAEERVRRRATASSIPRYRIDILHIAAFTPWAYLGRQLRAQVDPPPIPRWPTDQVKCFVAAIRRVDQEERMQLHALLQRTHELLLPFGEPLALNFGMNRWLRGEREEAYSDWLEWLFGQLRPLEICQVLCIPATHGVSSIIADFPDAPVAVRRELWVKQGHEGATGRLDLALTIGQAAVIVLEIKRGDAQSADTAKQEGYFDSLTDKKLPFYPVLLVTEAPQEEVHRFAVLRYADFCLALRQFVIENRHDKRGYVFLSFVLALAATLEMNVLGLNVTARKPNLSTLAYLSQFVEMHHE